MCNPKAVVAFMSSPNTKPSDTGDAVVRHGVLADIANILRLSNCQQASALTKSGWQRASKMKIELTEAHQRIRSAQKIDGHSVMCATGVYGILKDAIYPVDGGQVEMITKFGWVREYHFFTTAEVEASKVRVPFAMARE